MPGGDFSPLEFNSLLENYKKDFHLLKLVQLRDYLVLMVQFDKILGNKSNIKQLGIDLVKGYTNVRLITL